MGLVVFGKFWKEESSRALKSDVF